MFGMARVLVGEYEGKVFDIVGVGYDSINVWVEELENKEYEKEYLNGEYEWV